MTRPRQAERHPAASDKNSQARTVALVTCAMWPELFPTDQPLEAELVRRGHRVEVHPWNDAPLESFTEADLVVFRANWDYHHDMEGFARWLDVVEASDATLVNPAPLIRQFLLKDYLLRLIDAGLPLPATMIAESIGSPEVLSWVRRHEFERVVVKPVWGASGHGVEMVGIDDLAASEASEAVEAIRSHGRAVVVQEFVPHIINAGERALIFFDGEYSHGAHRQPGVGEYRVNSGFGGSVALADDIDPSMIELGKQALATLDHMPTYARIDMVGSGDDLLLMEVEINEPALWLHLAPGSEARFADALLAM